MLIQFLAELERILAMLTPAAIGYLAFRRLRLSRSFNRLIYGLVILHCGLVLEFFIRSQTGDQMSRELAQALVYSPLILWSYVLDATPTTRGASGGTRYAG